MTSAALTASRTLYSSAARMPAAARMTPKQGSSPDNTKERVKAPPGTLQSKALHGYTQATERGPVKAETSSAEETHATQRTPATA